MNESARASKLSKFFGEAPPPALARGGSSASRSPANLSPFRSSGSRPSTGVSSNAKTVAPQLDLLLPGSQLIRAGSATNVLLEGQGTSHGDAGSTPGDLASTSAHRSSNLWTSYDLSQQSNSTVQASGASRQHGSNRRPVEQAQPERDSLDSFQEGRRGSTSSVGGASYISGFPAPPFGGLSNPFAASPPGGRQSMAVAHQAPGSSLTAFFDHLGGQVETVGASGISNARRPSLPNTGTPGSTASIRPTAPQVTFSPSKTISFQSPKSAKAGSIASSDHYSAYQFGDLGRNSVGSRRPSVDTQSMSATFSSTSFDPERMAGAYEHSSVGASSSRGEKTLCDPVCAPFPCEYRALRRSILLDEPVAKYSLPRGMTFARKRGWRSRQLVLTSNGQRVDQRVTIVPSALGKEESSASMTTITPCFDFDVPYAEDLSSAPFACLHVFKPDGMKEQQRFVLAPTTYVAVADSGRRYGGGRHLLRIGGGSAVYPQEIESARGSVQSEEWLVQLDSIEQLLKWQHTIRALVAALAYAEGEFRTGRRYPRRGSAADNRMPTRSPPPVSPVWSTPARNVDTLAYEQARRNGLGIAWSPPEDGGSKRTEQAAHSARLEVVTEPRPSVEGSTTERPSVDSHTGAAGPESPIDGTFSVVHQRHQSDAPAPARTPAEVLRPISSTDPLLDEMETLTQELSIAESKRERGSASEAHLPVHTSSLAGLRSWASSSNDSINTEPLVHGHSTKFTRPTTLDDQREMDGASITSEPTEWRGQMPIRQARSRTTSVSSISSSPVCFSYGRSDLPPQTPPPQTALPPPPPPSGSQTKSAPSIRIAVPTSSRRPEGRSPTTAMPASQRHRQASHESNGASSHASSSRSDSGSHAAVRAWRSRPGSMMDSSWNKLSDGYSPTAVWNFSNSPSSSVGTVSSPLTPLSPTAPADARDRQATSRDRQALDVSANAPNALERKQALLAALALERATPSSSGSLDSRAITPRQHVDDGTPIGKGQKSHLGAQTDAQHASGDRLSAALRSHIDPPTPGTPDDSWKSSLPRKHTQRGSFFNLYESEDEPEEGGAGSEVPQTLAVGAASSDTGHGHAGRSSLGKPLVLAPPPPRRSRLAHPSTLSSGHRYSQSDGNPYASAVGTEAIERVAPARSESQKSLQGRVPERHTRHDSAAASLQSGLGGVLPYSPPTTLSNSPLATRQSYTLQSQQAAGSSVMQYAPPPTSAPGSGASVQQRSSRESLLLAAAAAAAARSPFDAPTSRSPNPSKPTPQRVMSSSDLLSEFPSPPLSMPTPPSRSPGRKGGGASSAPSTWKLPPAALPDDPHVAPAQPSFIHHPTAHASPSDSRSPKRPVGSASPNLSPRNERISIGLAM